LRTASLSFEIRVDTDAKSVGDLNSAMVYLHSSFSVVFEGIIAPRCAYSHTPAGFLSKNPEDRLQQRCHPAVKLLFSGYIYMRSSTGYDSFCKMRMIVQVSRREAVTVR
jgi:hypothetical protein